MLKFRSPLDFSGRGSRWQELFRVAGQSNAFRERPVDQRSGSGFSEDFGFGSNPGNLRMFTYRPARLAEDPALVVVLHGCTQTAAGYNEGAGWSTLANRYGFALLVPEQQRSNNPNGCFNWFLPKHSRRGEGEPLSIRQMVEKAVIDHGIDRRRIFVTGLSAGGAMTSIMLACYPEVFAAGAIVAGLPYGAAADVQQAFQSMHQSPSRSPREWGNLVRNASPHAGRWPRVSVWHGGADTTVIPSNALELIKQWTDVHGLPLSPSLETRVDGYPRQVWLSKAGEALIESYTIPNMSHGTPLAIGESEGACGAPGPFLLPVGISSSYHISKFFGIAHAAMSADDNEQSSRPSAYPAVEGPALEPDDDDAGRWRHGRETQGRSVLSVINDALKAAGLIKS